jgi:hypothetical protein
MLWFTYIFLIIRYEFLKDPLHWSLLITVYLIAHIFLSLIFKAPPKVIIVLLSFLTFIYLIIVGDVIMFLIVAPFPFLFFSLVEFLLQKGRHKFEEIWQHKKQSEFDEVTKRLIPAIARTLMQPSTSRGISLSAVINLLDANGYYVTRASPEIQKQILDRIKLFLGIYDEKLIKATIEQQQICPSPYQTLYNLLIHPWPEAYPKKPFSKRKYKLK